MTVKTVLSIAGSDSIGGAGIQADIKACIAHGANPMTVLTALTAQNTMGVNAVEAIATDMLFAQLEAVLTDLMPDAVKTGMIPTSASVELIAHTIRQYELRNIVVDPVMVATSGDTLSSADAQRSMLETLLPLATIVTPNIPEAEILTGLKISTREHMIRAAERLISISGCSHILVKCGHNMHDNSHADLLFSEGCTPQWFEHPHVETLNTHGTGCSLSSAIASNLATGFPVSQAVERAIDWLVANLTCGSKYIFGHGHGPAYIISPQTNELNKNI